MTFKHSNANTHQLYLPLGPLSSEYEQTIFYDFMP